MDLVSSATGKHVCTRNWNFVRDNVCGGNENTYNVVKSVTALGSIAVSGFQVVRSLKGLLEARRATNAAKAAEAAGGAKINPYEILNEHGIPTTLTPEQRAACDAEGLAMKAEPNEIGEFGRYKFKIGIDTDLRGKGTLDDALELAFQKTKIPKEEFKVVKWGYSKEGKSFPVEWEGPRGACVNIDRGHLIESEAPIAPHVGWQTSGKRGSGGAVRGHIFVDEVPYNRD